MKTKHVNYKLLFLVPLFVVSGCVAKYANIVQDVDFDEIKIKDIKDNKERVYVVPGYKLDREEYKIYELHPGDTIIIKTLHQDWYRKNTVLRPNTVFFGAKIEYPQKNR